jgi:competence protein ComEA
VPTPPRSSPLAALATLLALAATLTLARAHEHERGLAALRRAAPAEGPERPEGPPRLDEVLGPVDVNRASVAELERLPRIGPALAARIVAHRPYRAIEELARVPGIGPRTLERLRPFATVGSGP